MTIDTERRIKSNILFGIFLAIFLTTAVYAILFLHKIFMAEVPLNEAFLKFAYALWVTVLVEVASLIFLLAKDLFGLTAKEEKTELKNTVAEIFDGLESTVEDQQSIQLINQLRNNYADKIGISGTARLPS